VCLFVYDDFPQAGLGVLDAQTICSALKRAGGNRLAAAKELGVHKTTLFRKIRTLKIDLPEYDGRRHAAQQGSD